MSWPIQSYTSCRRGSLRDSDGSIALECRSARGFRLVRLTAPTRTDTFSTIKVTREVASTPRLGGGDESAMPHGFWRWSSAISPADASAATPSNGASPTR